MHAQHDRQEFLLQCEILCVDPIMGLEQPEATPLFHVCSALHAVHCMICSRFACAYKPMTSRNAPGVAVSLTNRPRAIEGNEPFPTC
jgi:hypothetical protein